MRKTKSALVLVLLLGVAASVGCSGGAGGVNVSPAHQTQASTPRTVSIHIVVPAASKTATAAIRRRMAIAEGTSGIVFTIYQNPQAAHPTALQTPAFDISQTSANCTTNADTSRTCALAITLAPGTYDVDATTYDATPVSGAIPGSAHALGAAALVGFSVTQGAANAINLSIDGIAAGVAVTLPIPVIRGLDTVTQQAALDVLDADGNTIVSNGFVDATGNPVSVTVADSSSSGLVTINPSTVSAPPTQGVSVAYNPTAISGSQMTAGVEIPVAATLSNGPSSSSVLKVVAPLSALVSFSGSVDDVTPYQSNLFVTLPGNQQADVVLPDGTHSPLPLASSAPIGPSPRPDEAVTGPDGNPYFTISNQAALGRFASYPTNEQGYTLTGIGKGITGVGTSVWVAEPTANLIADVTVIPSVSVAEYATAAGAQPTDLTAGPDAQIWFTEPGIDQIGAINESTFATSTYAIPTAAASPLGITLGADGNLWFAETAVKQIGRITTGGVVTEFTVGTAQPLYVASGPDGNIWFTFQSPSPGIGRISTATGSYAVFPFPAGSAPDHIVSSSGRLYVTDTAGNALYTVQP